MQELKGFPTGEGYPMGNFCKIKSYGEYTCSTDSIYFPTTTQYFASDNCMMNNFMWDSNQKYFTLTFGFNGYDQLKI